MKIDKVKILTLVALGLGFLGTIIENSANDLTMSNMKKELKEEILSEMKEENQ